MRDFPIEATHFTLDGYRSNVTSQHGEDGILAYLLDAYPGVPQICLEVGACDGVKLSNTHSLWAKRGWRALLIDQDTTALSRRFGHLPNLAIIKGSIAARGAASLDEMAKRLGFPQEIGVASIDIDSFDYWVFAGLDYLKPAIAIVEFNPRIPVDVDYCDPEGTTFLRHSAAAVNRLAKQKGYRVVACTGPNAILVSEATIATNPAAVPDLSINALFDHAYARRFPRIVGTQFITDLPVYVRPPSLIMRGYGWVRYMGLTLRSAWRGKPKPVHTISPALRAHVERSGLWV